MRAFVTFSVFVVAAGAAAAACGSSSGGSAGATDAGGDSSTGPMNDSGTTGLTDSSTTGDSGTTGLTDSGTPGTDASGANDGASSIDGTTVAPAGGHDGGCAASETAPAGGFPFPPVVATGGALLTAPRIVSVVFSTETAASQVAAFDDGLASTCYWDAIRAGYCEQSTCVGDGPAGTTIELSIAPAASYTDPAAGGGTLQTFLQSLIAAGTVPAPDANTLYALYFPTSTTINQDGALSCQDFDGYHSNMVVGGQNVYYAVIPECTAPQMSPAITTFQNTTITASHEAIETATDGDFNGFYLDLSQESTYGWNDVQGGEVADLCVDPFLLGLDEFTENGFTTQRVWSVTNASAGKNPCVPIPTGEVYFNTYPKDSLLVMDVGSSETIEIDALADGAMPAWTVVPQDWTDPTGQNTYLSFSFANDAGTAQMASGDSMQLTVKLIADPTNTTNGEADAVLVSANNPVANLVTAAHFWPFVVVTTAEAADAGLVMMKHPRHQGARGHLPQRPVRYRNVFGGFR